MTFLGNSTNLIKFINCFIFFLFFIRSNSIIGQQKQLSISIITVGPGEELYEKFGHSAIRVKAINKNIDLIFDYGIFDFNAPNFYLNFTKGKLLYKVASYPFHYFLRDKNQEKRWVKEQILNLSDEESQRFFNYLKENALPQNATYEYDPFFDNCATKPRDITKIILGDKVLFKEHFIFKKQSLRQLMNEEIYWNTWGNLGINIALGSRLDQIADANEYFYLPDYALKGFNTAFIKIKGRESKLVKKQTTILDFEEKSTKTSFFNPLFVLLIIMFLGLLITFRDYKHNKRSIFFDFILFLSTGFFGLLIVFLWFFTNHSTAPNNFNFLWAFAPNLLISIRLLKEEKLPSWLGKYLLVLLILMGIIPLLWLSKIQLFSWALLPLFILLVIRYLFLYHKTLNS
ncbi:lipoprotein N-acyltransferase Lnb domain-containing protein [Tenacibaculum maritimum]|uniref:lipoprotein N-acyltransferase Lnb domain-containing protein n=1 Tax=Tenacibaculum maritimum TaxID=107401 RepID=UPI00068560DC|nr:DUF4105 domain-containing protein [Tenacibaculum maritimum]